MPELDGITLTVVRGPSAGSRFAITTGVPTDVGRAAECAIVIDDASLSRRHFEILWNPPHCEIRDLGSRNGVYVNGGRIDATRVRPGARIGAGDSEFVLELDATVAGPTPLFPDVEPTLSPDAPPSADPVFGRLLGAISADVSLYALVDGASAFELAFAGRLMGHALYSLFTGSLAATVASVGPCLVAIAEPSAFLTRWAAANGSHAGVLLQSKASLADLHRHLRSIFVVSDEEGAEYFFRYYDPRVMRTFLPTCRESELREFFGPVDQWLVEADQTAGYLAYRLKENELVTQTLT
jgi:hypothetical protein